MLGLVQRNDDALLTVLGVLGNCKKTKFQVSKQLGAPVHDLQGTTFPIVRVCHLLITMYFGLDVRFA